MKETIATFKALVAATHPRATFVEERVKHWTKNVKIMLPRAGEIQGPGTTKLGRATVAKIPRARFEPALVGTGNKRVALLGTKLAVHGGQLAVEKARQLAKEFDTSLVVLGTIVFPFVTVQWQDGNRDPGSMEGALKRFSAMQDKFTAWLDALMR